MPRTVGWFAIVSLVATSALSQEPLSQEPLPQEREIWRLPVSDSPSAPTAAARARRLEGAEVAGRPVMRLTDVSMATLEIFPADPARATGTAVIVCPGGGYGILAYDLEGTEIAEWLQGLGVTALVLKYRVPGAEDEAPGERPLEDLQQAIRAVRARAAELNVDPEKVGVLGFSAGGHLTVMSGTPQSRASAGEKSDRAADTADTRPNFLIPIYPAYLVEPESNPPRLDPSLQPDSSTPPMFMAITQDDADRAIGAALLMIELKRHEVPVELHVFVRGGHGYGLRPSDNAVSQWPRLCEQWMRAMGFL